MGVGTLTRRLREENSSRCSLESSGILVRGGGGVIGRQELPLSVFAVLQHLLQCLKSGKGTGSAPGKHLPKRWCEMKGW